jgi:ElaB/YqjD/DUF883 family membrane-anchored ribosome-binding protein
MNTDTRPSYGLSDNPVEQVTDVASDAIAATRSTANSALDATASSLESWRSSLSPYVDAAIDYTRKEPLKALAWAMAAGALLAMLRPRRR